MVAQEGHGDMKAVWHGVLIAESPDTVIVEGNHYFPLPSVNAALLEPSTHTSVCPWKGTANYYSLRVGDERNANAVWYYADSNIAMSRMGQRTLERIQADIPSTQACRPLDHDARQQTLVITAAHRPGRLACAAPCPAPLGGPAG